ncbi:ABC transporter permease [Periweissella cryptocerci]|uniref:ABC transporter permease n=1 Tax=Periweissella cryptocerci TaxID=2506420 RepID=A0A4P6YUQ9_9LACO|nr:FtsX-like permease family protein [Periweissella cryptocerci]QBO36490.1 ABC transporter permease [Periweissella cryptocerci]
MNFLNRAWLNLRHKKGRSLLLVLVTSAILIFVLAGLIIQNAAVTATQNAQKSAGATVTLSANREKMFAQMQAAREAGETTRPAEATATVAQVKKIAALANVAGYSISNSASVNANGFDPIESSSSSQGGFGGGQGGTSRGGESNKPAQGDMNIAGVSTSASAAAFTGKTATLVDGRGITASDENTNNIMIEKNLADQDSLKVGDTVKVKSTDGKQKISLKIVGIYQLKSTATEGFSPIDPSNTIYASYTLANTLNGTVDQAANVTFTLSEPSKANAFVKAAKKLIDTNKLQLTADDAAYKALLTPLNNIKSFASKIVILVAVAGVIILTLIIVLMVRERRHEMGVLLSIGERKAKIVGQLFFELFAVLVISLGIAGVTGNYVGQTVGNQLVAQQTAQAKTTSETTGQPGSQGGRGMGGQLGAGGPGGMRGGMTNQASPAQLKQLNTTLNMKTLGELGGFGLVIILVAVSAASINILRLKPKRILTNE